MIEKTVGKVGKMVVTIWLEPKDHQALKLHGVLTGKTMVEYATRAVLEQMDRDKLRGDDRQ